MYRTANLTGQYLIDGVWTGGGRNIRSAPARGKERDFASGGAAAFDRAAQAAEVAFETCGSTSRDERAAFLESISDEIDARGAAITAIGSAGTGRPEARFDGELGRTTGRLRLFAAHIRKGDYPDRRHDPPFWCPACCQNILAALLPEDLRL